MCRFVAYVGRPITIDEVLIKPNNSLINQSYDAEEMTQTLNGDGFGLGYYARDIRPNPGLFRSITPAWNNQNLRHNASLIRTDCMFAHIRAATVGTVAEFNCHPFGYEEFLMMHNGGIAQFSQIKRKLMERLSDETFLWIKGQTDSEHVFALLMQIIFETREKKGERLDRHEIAQCFRITFDYIEELKTAAGTADMPSSFNMMITDGQRIFGTRYSTDPDKAMRTLYYLSGEEYVCENGVASMEPSENGKNEAVLIASERLTEDAHNWSVVPQNHFIAVERDLSIHIAPL